MAKIKIDEEYIKNLSEYLQGIETRENIELLFKDIQAYQYNYLQNESNGLSILGNYDLFPATDIKAELDRIKNDITQYNNKTDKIVEEAYKLSTPIIQKQIETHFMPYLRQLIEMSNSIDVSLDGANTEDNKRKYEASCMLKCFVVEFSSKILHMLSNEDLIKEVLRSRLLKSEGRNITNPKQRIEVIAKRLVGDNLTGDAKEETQFKFVNSLVGEIKDTERVLEEVKNNNIKRITGHEIEIMFNSLPESIKNFVKYKTMTSLVIPDITKKGQIPDVSNFFQAPDFLIMVKEFSDDEKDKIRANNKLVNDKLKDNNSGFINYRYLQQKADLLDYEVLNSLAISMYEILDFSSKNAITLQERIPTDYESLKTTFTQDEYNNLIQLSQRNPNSDLESIISYYAFMKTYIDTKKIDMNDRKYKNINKFFNMVKSSNNITSLGDQFCSWYSSIDLTQLTPEEIEELRLIDPKFIYNSLSYTDKLIYQKCKDKNIDFAFYYKINPKTFELIINKYPHYFEGRKIGEHCIRKDPTDIARIESVLNRKHLNLGEVPDYYFKYLFEDIVMITNQCEGIAPELAFQRILFHMNKAFEKPIDFFDGGSQLYKHQYMERRQNEDYTYGKLQEQIEEVIKLIQKHSVKTYEELSKYGNYDAEVFYRAKNIETIIRIAKISDITPYVTMPMNQLSARSFELCRAETTKPVDLRQDPTSMFDAFAKDDKVLKQFIDLIKTADIKPQMKYIETYDLMLMYSNCQKYVNQMYDDPSKRPTLPISEYLLYSTPQEAKQIINICKEYNLEFRPEMLYFNPTDLEQLGPAIVMVPDFIQTATEKSQRENSQFTYQDAESILKNTRNAAVMLQKYMPTIDNPRKDNTELNDMFAQKEESKKENQYKL